MRRGRGICIAAAVSVVLVGVGCSSSSSQSICRRSNGAELCLRGDGKAYKLEGSGFRARSELAVILDGNEDRPMVLPIDDGGKTSRAGVVGVLAGPVEQRVTVSGMSTGGLGTTFDFVVPASR
ncbi:MAG: hypothetical protein ACR2MO_17450 [Acidimicrobiales bacterium]